MTARNLTIFMTAYYEKDRRCPVTYREVEYEIQNGMLELHNIAGCPNDYIKYYPLSSISSFIVNFNEDEDYED